MDNRRVAETYAGKVRVSTVFLGLDHRYGEDGPPLLFETMAFGLDGDELVCERWATWDEAVAGHQRVVAQFPLPKRKRAMNLD